jgi:hypothetical protein
MRPIEFAVASRVVSVASRPSVALPRVSDVAFVALGEAAARIVQSLSTKVEDQDRQRVGTFDSPPTLKRF